MSELNSHELLQQYENGHSEAATIIFDRYVTRLVALARTRIGKKLQRRVDPEDVVQSAYRSFFVHAKNEEYVLNASGDLWRLLATITLNKVNKQVEKQTAAKRSLEREEADGISLATVKSPEPTAEEVVSIIEQLQLVLSEFSPDERIVFTSRLQGQSIEDISKSIKKSERTVRRILLNMKQQIEQQLQSDEITGAFRSQTTKTKLAEPDAPLEYSDYLLEQLLGSGGMGKLYRATEKRSGKTVAVKALRKSKQSDLRAVRQFIQEAQILRELKHPHIVSVQGLGRFPAGGYFIVMDFIDGVDLQSQLNLGPLPIRKAVSIVLDVTSAVAHAHEHGIIHCDLKPANVLLDKNEHIYVTDFGFAFLLANQSELNAVSLGGTQGYMAPEIENLTSKPTSASDIYSLGVLLWTLSFGNLPKQQDLKDNATNSEPLRSICLKCLATDLNQRFVSVSSLREALKKLEQEIC